MFYKYSFLKEYFKRSILFSVGMAHLFINTAYVFADPCYPLPQNINQLPPEVKAQHEEIKKTVSEQEKEREEISELMSKCMNFSTGTDSYIHCAQGLANAFNLNSRLSIESLVLRESYL